MDKISVGKESDDINISSDNCTTYQGYDTNADENIRQLAREFTRNSQINPSELHSIHHSGSDELENEMDKDIDADNYTRYQLLRTMTSMSQVPGVAPVGDDFVDERLDPMSDKFDSKFWVKNIRKLMDADPDYYKPTSLGFAAKNLIAKGISSDADYQANFMNYPFKVARDLYLDYLRKNDESRYFQILKSMDVLIKPGTLTVVLGRPGSGCSTFLKTVASQTYGFHVDNDSVISYDGLTPSEIDRHYRGEVIFSAEMDNHFPHLTVGQTLEFAAQLRTPQNRFPGVNRTSYAKHMSQVSTLFYFELIYV